MLGIIIGAFVLMALFGTKTGSEELETDIAILSAQAAEKRLEARELLNAFDAIEEQREITTEDLELLEKAIVLHRKVISLTQRTDLSAIRLLDETKTRYDSYRGKFIYDESQAEEMKGMALIAEGKIEEGLYHLKKAHHLQENIHEDFPRSEFAIRSRLLRLDRNIDEAGISPDYKKSERLEAEALKAIDAGEYKEAAAMLDEAIALQKTINQNHRLTQYANTSRLTKLENDRDSIRAGRQNLEINRLIDEGDALIASGEYREAESKLQVALENQLQLNRIFGQSRFASVEKIEKIERLMQTAGSSTLAQEIQADNQALEDALRSRDHASAINYISDIAKRIERLRTTFPKSRHIDEQLIERVEFLRHKQEGLRIIQNRVHEQLLPLQDSDGVSIMGSEVSQALYAKVMDSNPSRNPGNTLPVDSITLEEAQEFCRRLSWLLGLNVQLPTKAQFEDAVGAVAPETLRSGTWNRSSSDGNTKDVATSTPSASGAYDLLGNVGEWISTPANAGADRALVAGGSIADSAERLGTIPFIETDTMERNRFVGFRFTVETK